ncbi:hypothetical protein F75 [Sulfolobus turreted icosahedral virus 1]|uniref:Uncharacterized protein n=1 Tax=Sulfolobus turreted icosahedral virus 1 TaxID=269145 RepID=Q6Q0L1_9VIRU|nr:hypothetical protein F75 [Sulfolobus turreted icosahedral virus 1]AAS89080.1 hypothetical protein F75 [Sulfolobus turreted icosahedral virus 1]
MHSLFDLKFLQILFNFSSSFLFRYTFILIYSNLESDVKNVMPHFCSCIVLHFCGRLQFLPCNMNVTQDPWQKIDL